MATTPDWTSGGTAHWLAAPVPQPHSITAPPSVSAKLRSPEAAIA